MTEPKSSAKAKRTLEVYPDISGQWRWRAKAGNGEITATGEAYSRKQGAIDAAVAEYPDTEVTVVEPGPGKGE